MTVATPTITHHQIATLVDQGMPLDEIESDVIETAPALNDEERAALWLFAWGRERHNRELRRLARRREPLIPGL